MTPKICLSLKQNNLEEMGRILDEYSGDYDIVEVRSDIFQWDSIEEIVRVIGNTEKILLSIRSDVDFSELGKLCHSLTYIDVELEEYQRHTSLWDNLSKGGNFKFIVSYHDYSKTPEDGALEKLLKDMGTCQCDYLKVAAFAKCKEDMARLLYCAGKHNEINERKVIAVSMGEEGQASRLCAGEFGSPITYGYANEPTAPGQIQVKKLKAYVCQYYEVIV